MKPFATIWIVALVSTVVTAAVWAQDVPPPPMHGRAAERLEQYKKVRLMDALKLDEETSVRFMARYNKQLEDLRQIGKERNTIVDRIETLVKQGGTDAVVQSSIDDLTKVEAKLAGVRQNFLSDLHSILTPRQIAQYVVFERDFNRNLRDALRERAQDRWQRRQGR